MHVDELHTAVTKIVDHLNEAGIRAAVDQYRSSKGDQRSAAVVRLSHAGAIMVEKLDAMSPNEKKVVKCLHLESLGSTEYWQGLVAGNGDPKQHQLEIVRLASRVMFANSHLPSMISLLTDVQATPAPVMQVAAPSSALLLPVEQGEGALFIRLTDAGEKASDPDRVARAIDGVDMLYSACASIARKPAMDLRLDNVAAKINRDRDFRFTGDKDSISAVFAVIDSIPGALADIDPDQDINLDTVVRSLPVFQDLHTLASLGTFSGKDLKDISETMHQGALLTLESGVILVDEDMVAQGEMQHDGNVSLTPNSQVVANAQVGANPPSAAESDEHYNRYLREREAMTRSPSADDNADLINGQGGLIDNSESGVEDQTRKDAVDELLKSLGQSKPS